MARSCAGHNLTPPPHTVPPDDSKARYNQPIAIMWFAHSLQCPFAIALGCAIVTVMDTMETKVGFQPGGGIYRTYYHDQLCMPSWRYLLKAALMSTMALLCGVLWFESIPLTSAVVGPPVPPHLCRAVSPKPSLPFTETKPPLHWLTPPCHVALLPRWIPATDSA